ncbi:phosphatase PAP2 family protein [Janthinobacterium fluminis]|uniref:Phosphatase PAP2 family protein n=1 Tax=Janthinobacterium fluminis TaxID=2987524 RepID=A0ABT5K2W0_9BURK|nr:phosphatase PAP2 family protein [Janthinobacterium fluminis]MDC8759244.1 phosphatase PAP2 family protein [Janthinobacterium fluminis]
MNAAAPATLASALHEHRWLSGIVLLYGAAAFLVHRQFPASSAGNMLEGFAVSTLIGPLFTLCGYAIYVMLLVRPANLTRFLFTSSRRYLRRERLLHALPVLLLFPLFASSFTVFKAAVPVLHPYAWDRHLADWDLALHGGVAPWLWLQTVVGHPYVTAIINFAYHFWFFLVYAILYWLALSMDKRQLRMQFLLSFVLSWILLGNVLATLLSSVGPCFYGYLYPGHDPYAPLMHYLQASNQSVPVWALNVQQMLWNGYQDHSSSLGISAMPSMHVATAVLLALWGWRVNRRAGAALTLFALLIMVGSVHLGWHYALDGYVGAAGAYAVWRGVGALLARAERRGAEARPAALPPGVVYLRTRAMSRER